MGLLHFELYLLHSTPPQFITKDAQIVATLGLVLTPLYGFHLFPEVRMEEER